MLGLHLDWLKMHLDMLGLHLDMGTKSLLLVQSQVVVSKTPLYTNDLLLYHVTKGSGHNCFGELAWPNDIVCTFLPVVLGFPLAMEGLSLLYPSMKMSPCDPFATPSDLLPEWYLYSVFNLLRLLPKKVVGLLSMADITTLLIGVLVCEHLECCMNPMRRVISGALFLSSLCIVCILGAFGCCELFVGWL